jgi:hypothetical protein
MDAREAARVRTERKGKEREHTTHPPMIDAFTIVSVSCMHCVAMRFNNIVDSLP